ncbi:MAG: glutaredoxin 3 [Planctomycetota bacterium]|jgi:glutaredoxin 3
MKAEIYTKTTCPFCVQALELLEARGIETVNHVMDNSPLELMEAKKQYNHGTVPIVIIDGEYIGGNDDLRQFDSEGKLTASA